MNLMGSVVPMLVLPVLVAVDTAKVGGYREDNYNHA